MEYVLLLVLIYMFSVSFYNYILSYKIDRKVIVNALNVTLVGMFATLTMVTILTDKSHIDECEKDLPRNQQCVLSAVPDQATLG